MAKKPRALPTQAELEALWHPRPDFIGPVGPPMELWIRDREKQAAWRKQEISQGINIDASSFGFGTIARNVSIGPGSGALESS